VPKDPGFDTRLRFRPDGTGLFYVHGSGALYDIAL
jgi:hypothetical protein